MTKVPSLDYKKVIKALQRDGRYSGHACIVPVPKSNRQTVLRRTFILFCMALVYVVGATHLLPQAETEKKKYSLFAPGAGILAALVIVLSKG